MTFKDVYNKYGAKIWSVSGHYLFNDKAYGPLSREDLYQETLTRLYVALNNNRVRDDEKKVTSFIISTMLDMIRTESVRRKEINKLLDDVIVGRKIFVSTDDAEYINQHEKAELAYHLATILPKDVFLTVWEWVFPSVETVKHAINDNAAAEQQNNDVYVKMNITEVKVFKKHVAKTLKKSPATIARLLAESRQILEREYNEKES